MEFLDKHIEALIFCSVNPLKITEIQECLSALFDAEVPIEDIQQAVDKLIARYAVDDFSLEIVFAGGGYQFMTKPSYQETIGLLLKQTSKKRLSRSALETLSIIAYKQPVSRPDLEQVRGVNCDYALKRLLEKELIEIRGKSDSVGKPLLYGTTEKFLEYFGINSIKELPTLKDFDSEENQIGTPSEE